MKEENKFVELYMNYFKNMVKMFLTLCLCCIIMILMTVCLPILWGEKVQNFLEIFAGAIEEILYW